MNFYSVFIWSQGIYSICILIFTEFIDIADLCIYNLFWLLYKNDVLNMGLDVDTTIKLERQFFRTGISMRVPNLVPIGPQAATCIRPEGYTDTHTLSYIDIDSALYYY